MLTGTGFVLQQPSHIVTTNASLFGWWAHCEGYSVQGSWTASEAKLHISLLVFKAVHYALVSFSDLF